jgi:hypothetical protein
MFCASSRPSMREVLLNPTLALSPQHQPRHWRLVPAPCHHHSPIPETHQCDPDLHHGPQTSRLPCDLRCFTVESTRAVDLSLNTVRQGSEAELQQALQAETHHPTGHPASPWCHLQALPRLPEVLHVKATIFSMHWRLCKAAGTATADASGPL